MKHYHLEPSLWIPVEDIAKISRAEMLKLLKKPTIKAATFERYFLPIKRPGQKYFIKLTPKDYLHVPGGKPLKGVLDIFKKESKVLKVGLEKGGKAKVTPALSGLEKVVKPIIKLEEVTKYARTELKVTPKSSKIPLIIGGISSLTRSLKPLKSEVIVRSPSFELIFGKDIVRKLSLKPKIKTIVQYGVHKIRLPFETKSKEITPKRGGKGSFKLQLPRKIELILPEKLKPKRDIWSQAHELLRKKRVFKLTEETSRVLSSVYKKGKAKVVTPLTRELIKPSVVTFTAQPQAITQRMRMFLSERSIIGKKEKTLKRTKLKKVSVKEILKLWGKSATLSSITQTFSTLFKQAEKTSIKLRRGTVKLTTTKVPKTPKPLLPKLFPTKRKKTLLKSKKKVSLKWAYRELLHPVAEPLSLLGIKKKGKRRKRKKRRRKKR